VAIVDMSDVRVQSVSEMSLTLLVTRHWNDVNTVSRSTLQSLLCTANVQLIYSTLSTTIRRHVRSGSDALTAFYT